jgi:hypothetical protein
MLPLAALKATLRVLGRLIALEIAIAVTIALKSTV